MPNQITLCNAVKIADTLQGSVWRASSVSNDSQSSSVVIKVTNRKQHNNAIGVIDNQIYHNMKENIVLEQMILEYLTEQPDFPQSVVKFVSFVKTNNDYCLLMEDGGNSLFDFVRSVHNLIKKGHIDIVHWKSVVKIIFKQMIECIEFIHDHNVCHNDISLENFVINDMNVVVQNNNKMLFQVDDIRIKLCDFGLAELHSNNQCISNKHCGKRQYKSPEVLSKKSNFCGKKNDIWCAGICLFILSFGCGPFAAASADNKVFAKFMKGEIVDVLALWDLTPYVEPHVIELLRCIFKYERNRITVAEMKRHPVLFYT